MSVQTQITRIINDKVKIREKMISLGLATSTDNLDTLANSIEGIVNNGAVQAQVKEGESYTIPAGYHNGSGVIEGVGGGGDYTLQAKTVTPTKQQQSVTSDNGYYGLSSVTVNPIPDNYQDVSDTTAVADDVLATKIFVAADGTITAGTMPNNGAINGTINGLDVTTYTIPRGYHSGAGIVALDNSIENALAAI